MLVRARSCTCGDDAPAVLWDEPRRLRLDAPSHRSTYVTLSPRQCSHPCRLVPRTLTVWSAPALTAVSALAPQLATQAGVLNVPQWYESGKIYAEAHPEVPQRERFSIPAVFTSVELASVQFCCISVRPRNCPGHAVRVACETRFCTLGGSA